MTKREDPRIWPGEGEAISRAAMLEQDALMMKNALRSIARIGQTPFGMSDIGRLAMDALDRLSSEGKKL